MNKLLLLVASVSLLAAGAVRSAESSPAAGRVLLPQQHLYQQQLRTFMATLKEQDFQPAHQDLQVVPWEGDDDEKLRMWVLSLQPPSVGRKRNYSSVMLNAAYFTLDAIEGPQSVLRPPAHPEPLVDLANWRYPGNPYAGARSLRLRAFVLAALDMMMLDQWLDRPEDKETPSQNQLTTAIGRFAYVVPGIREVLPDKVLAAYLTGLKKLVDRALANGPQQTSRNQGMFTSAAPALFMAAQVLNQPELSQQAEAYARTIFTDERFFREVGYFPNGGTLDSFNGISTYFAVWGSLASDWPFAREAIAKVCRLRSHLTLPDPDGVVVGPSHMASLTSAETAHEQWDWPMRSWGAALVSDEAACLTRMPSAADLQNAPALVVAEINMQLHERATIPGRIDPEAWKFEAVGTVVNFAYQYYPQGYCARRGTLESQSDAARLPALRDGDFLRTFQDEFLVAKSSTYAAILHTGPSADPTSANPAYGFGGGALSAFWTRDSGTVILGRGIGAYSPQYKQELEAWRSLPSHAVTGITSDGKVFTSAHIVKPETTVESNASQYTVNARGLIPSFRHSADKRLAGKHEYVRKFESAAAGVHITTTLQSDGQDTIAELYEVLPIFLREEASQPQVVPTAIEFQVDGKWFAAADTWTESVTAVRLTRFSGAVDITFDRPRRMKLAPGWTDTYQTHSACRNLLIDLLESGDRSEEIKGTREVGYRIEAVVGKSP